MWIPKTEQDIINSTSDASIEETIIFDAKKEIPPKNSDVAKDVSAMANSAGGVIVFGIEEDVNGRPTIPSPLELKGQRERIDNIIKTSISEVPVFSVSAIESEADSSKGYLVLIIPPSERAPHMVVVKNDRRYYGRGETGNYVLSEPEIARLYERRQQTTQNLLPLLKEQVINAPISDHRGHIHLHLIIKPVLDDDSIIEKAIENFSRISQYPLNEQQLLNSLMDKVRGKDIFPYINYSIDFPSPNRWIHQTNGYLGKLSVADSEYRTPNSETLELKVGFNGSGNLFCGYAGKTALANNHEPEVKFFFDDIAASNTTRFLAFFGCLYEFSYYTGMVDVGIALTGLENAVWDNNYQRQLRPLYTHNESEYLRVIRTSALALKENPKKVASDLLMRLITTISQGKSKSFKD